MTILTIQIPDKDRDLFEQLAQRLNGKIINSEKENDHPNDVTKKAIADARLGKVKKKILIYSSKNFNVLAEFHQ